MFSKTTTRPHCRRFVTSFVLAGQGAPAYREGQLIIFPSEREVPETLRRYSVELESWEAIPAGTERFDADWFRTNTSPAPPPPAEDVKLFLEDIQRALGWDDKQFTVGKGHLPKPDGGTLSGRAWWYRNTIRRWREALDVISGRAAGTTWG